MTRILAFTPYTLWDLHVDYETTITRACKLRGAEVKHLRCDSLFSQCDMSDAGISPEGRPPEFCTMCRSRGDAKFEGTGLDIEWFSHYLEPEEKREASEWAENLTQEQLVEARFRDQPVGEWVLSSMVSYFRTFPVEVEDPKVAKIFRGFLQAGALTYLGLTRVFDQWQPEALVVFNGRRSVTYIAFLLARQRGIRVLIHERPMRPSTIMVAANEHCLSPAPFKQLWKDWGDRPLTREQLEAVAAWLRDRRFGRNQKGVYLFASAPGQQDVVREALALTPGRKVAALFTSSTDEFAGTPGFAGPFASQEAWIEGAVDWAAKRPEYDLVIRAHPNLLGIAGGGGAYREIAWLKQLQLRLPENVRLVMPRDPLSTYDLMDIATAGITYGSTAGVEMFALGKPVVTTPPIAFYDEVAGVLRVSSPNEMTAVLDQAMEQMPSRERRRFAFRSLYRYYFHLALPFPLVSVVRPTDSWRNYQSETALLPGKDPSLDRICGFLLANAPLFPVPEEAERQQTEDVEDDFFARIEADPRWLEFGWKERGQAKLDQARSQVGKLATKIARHAPSALYPLLRCVWNALPRRWRRAFQ